MYDRRLNKGLSGMRKKTVTGFRERESAQYRPWGGEKTTKWDYLWCCRKHHLAKKKLALVYVQLSCITCVFASTFHCREWASNEHYKYMNYLKALILFHEGPNIVAHDLGAQGTQKCWVTLLHLYSHLHVWQEEMSYITFSSLYTEACPLTRAQYDPA